jgi:hypothetical protein
MKIIYYKAAPERSSLNYSAAHGQVGIPPAERFAALRADALVIGPGRPPAPRR